MFRSGLLRLTGLLVVCHLARAGQLGSIAGKVVDSEDSFLPLPKVHIKDQSNEGRQYETTGDRKGQFLLDSVEPGIYAVKISVRGFLDKTLLDVRVAAEEQSDLATLRLNFAGCDAPGVICDDFGLKVYDDPIHKGGTMEITQRCAVDIDEAKSSCNVKSNRRGTIATRPDTVSDFWITPGRAGELYLSPRNGASFALDPPTEWS